ncbi:substrate-binding domain-containing protein [Algibacillus agarilyticus]|uniref:substrate-binding domain-containing protein n=1 Tax=Algibacillus agarilyticus TaxID=2234133 RepID=UPI000DCF717E|nr:substrate-binding domain-containing protein [Algibacillus agarilyticus]
MTTLQDVATKAGVSSSTVSRIISGKGKFSEEVNQRVQTAITELKYRPNSNARALASNQSDIIGIIIPNIAAPFYATIAAGAEAAAKRLEYKTLIANSYRNAEEELNAINTYRDQGCESIIIHSLTLDKNILIELAAEIPGLIILGRLIPEIANRCVWLDNMLGGKLAAQSLVDLGHKDFALISYAEDLQDPQERISGIMSVCENQGIKIRKDAIIFSAGNIADGQHATKTLLNSGLKFSAIIAYNDLMAVGAINELLDNGIRVPEDISVIGFDDIQLAEMYRPKLTTIKYPIHNMAEYAVELAITLAQGPDKYVDRTHLFMPYLIERQSVTTAYQAP